MSTATMTHEKAATGSVCWFEIPADNLDRAKKFYNTLFGWKIAPIPGMQGPEAQNYLHVDTGGDDASPDGGLMSRKQPDETITQYIGVASVDESAAKVEQLGGKIRTPKTAVPHMGYFAVCQDTEDNMFGLWETDSNAK
ncbi:MAG TPA: VOC family protein [Opitutaceae bacterium]|nr:VOC family protein [Opitutaceae bacterium]